MVTSMVRKELRAVTDVTRLLYCGFEFEITSSSKRPPITAFPLMCEIFLNFRLVQHTMGCANKSCIIDFYVYKINSYGCIVTPAEVNGAYR